MSILGLQQIVPLPTGSETGDRHAFEGGPWKDLPGCGLGAVLLLLEQINPISKRWVPTTSSESLLTCSRAVVQTLIQLLLGRGSEAEAEGIQ